MQMTRDDLLRLIAQGEGTHLEFKRSVAELEDGVRTVAAFANADGGAALFSVRDNGTVAMSAAIPVGSQWHLRGKVSDVSNAR